MVFYVKYYINNEYNISVLLILSFIKNYYDFNDSRVQIILNPVNS